MLKLLRLATWAVMIGVACQPGVHAGGGPQNVAVIVNPDDPDSLAIANYYVELRDIPETNVFYIPWRTDVSAAAATHIRDRLIKPFVTALEARGLAEQIDFVAFSSGYPYLVNFAPLLGDQQFPRHLRPITSLTSAMFYYQDALAGDTGMFSLSPHEYFAPTINGRTATAAFSKHGQEGKPRRHLLATALGVTFGHGNTGGEITASLRRAHAADGTKPRGTIYYLQNNNVRSKVRDGTYAAAVGELAAAGVKAAVVNGIAPQGKADVAGLTTGAPHVDLKAAECTLLPGALVDNLTSAGGQMVIRSEGNPQTRISEYIRLGAAGASGTVVEPFAIPQKFPTAALHIHYARGCSLAEAYYQSVAAPFHLLIVGDPLCQPWAQPPKVHVTGIREDSPIAGAVEITAHAIYPDARRAIRFEVYVDGVRTQVVSPGAPITLDSTKLADGWHELRVIAIDGSPAEIQGCFRRPFEVRNGDEALQISAEGPIRAAADDTIKLDVASDVQADAHIHHNGRQIAAVAGGTGTAEFKASVLGKGRTKIHAEQAGPTPLRSRPVIIEIN